MRKANAVWRGDLPNGNGKMSLESGAFEGSYSFDSRFADGKGSNPEELIAAAHAGCFSMALAHAAAGEGYKPKEINTSAIVSLSKVGEGFEISMINLECEADIGGADEAEFLSIANDAKVNCPVSKALSPKIHVSLSAKLKER